LVFVLPFLFSVLTSFAQEATVNPYQKFRKDRSITVYQEKGKENSARGLLQKQEIEAGYPRRSADIWIEIQVPEEGTYILESETQPLSLEDLKSSDKTGKLTLNGYIQLGDTKVSKRIFFD